MGFLHEELLHGAVLFIVLFSSDRFSPQRFCLHREIVSTAKFSLWRDFLHGEIISTARLSPRRGSLHEETLHRALLSLEDVAIVPKMQPLHHALGAVAKSGSLIRADSGAVTVSRGSQRLSTNSRF
jgi:hypothetical protein